MTSLRPSAVHRPGTDARPRGRLRSAWLRTAAGTAVAVAAAAVTSSLVTGGHGALAGTAVAVGGPSGRVQVVAAESQYADVAARIGGRYVHVTALMTNPDTDPHDFEASIRAASEVNQAQLAVQNGLGYDEFLSKLEAAVAPRNQFVVVAANLVRHPPGQAYDPHLWYYPATMPAVAAAIASDLARLRPAHAAYFRARLADFRSSMRAWVAALRGLRAAYPHAPVAVTEPVADYLLQAAGLRILTPVPLQVSVMDGTDPSPQDISAQAGLIAHHHVRALVYNEQVQDSLTRLFLSEARRAGVAVVGVYETMPRGHSYVSWMVSTVSALRAALGARAGRVAP